MVSKRSTGFPAKIAAEQCSSEQTALYKQRLVDPQAHVCDLTGGLGIDSYFFPESTAGYLYRTLSRLLRGGYP